jgi:peptide/nickel transport system substrate-binding protein
MADEGSRSASASASASEPGRRSRRRFIWEATAAGGALVGAPALLAACGGGGNAFSAAAPVGKPKLGGVLHVGQSAGGATDTLDAQKGQSICDFARIRQLYDGLADRDHQFKSVPALGTEFIPNRTGEEMLVKLRPGVTFHNGKSLTADDVVFTFRRMLDPKTGADGFAQMNPVLSGVEAVDALTVRFKFKFPFREFQDFASQQGTMGIIPVGYDPKHPVGTGPFKFESFTPGQESVFTRNAGYWGLSTDFLGSKGPYLDSVVITNINDDATRVNALTSGTVDAIDSVPYALLPTITGSSTANALISKTGNWYPIGMRVDRAPFNDVRVRQAFRLIVDRPQMIEQAYGGQARLGNDLYGIDDTLYDHDIPQRIQDIEQARFLLKKAGREGLTVNLVTAPIQNGVVQSCVVFAQQAKAAGVNVQITKLDNTTFYNSQYEQRVFSVDTWSDLSLLGYAADNTLTRAIYNGCHYSNAQFDKWYYKAVGSADEATRKEIARSMQQQLADEGGYIIPGFPNIIDAYSKKVTGFVPDAGGFNLSDWEFKNVWFV